MKSEAEDDEGGMNEFDEFGKLDLLIDMH